MSDTNIRLTAAKGRLQALAEETPVLFEGLTKITKTATRDGTFTSAQKELIATAVAVTQGCEDCILFHVDGAKRHGAEEAMLIEALEVAIEMGGGPAVMYAGKALDAFRSL